MELALLKFILTEFEFQNFLKLFTLFDATNVGILLKL